MSTRDPHSSILLSQKGVPHFFKGVGFAPSPAAATITQVHSADVIVVDHKGENPLCGDGLVTRTPGLELAVQTADCLPLLFHHPDIVAAIHAGWRGLGKNILVRTLNVMSGELGKNVAKEVTVAIGPSISPKRFEVGPEVREFFHRHEFSLAAPQQQEVWTRGKSDRWFLDLQLLACLVLIECGVQRENIEVIRTCTYDDAKNWHSYRREGKLAGRNWSGIKRQRLTHNTL